MMDFVLVPIYGRCNGKNGVVAEAKVDREDAPLVTGYRWNLNNGYAQFTRRGVPTVFMHRLILPDCAMIDHINRDRLDNRRENLRPASASQNNQNRQARTTLYKGVRRYATGYAARISLGQRRKVSGPSRPTALEAALDYDCLAYQVHGSGAFLNVPEMLDSGRLLLSIYL